MTGFKRDVYREITQSIIVAIEAGAGDFQMPWHAGGMPLSRPINALTGKTYRGVNVVALWATGQGRGYASNLWATFRQWAKLGAHVRKGEHATLIVFYKQVEKKVEGAASDEKATTAYLVARASFVFNVEQVEGYRSTAPAPRGLAETHEAAEAFVAKTRATVRHGGDRAYYRPATDHVQMPERERFVGTSTSTALEAYYATLLHELTHWTAHPRRLDRNLAGRFGDEAYAMEELVAELGAAFLCADLGIVNAPRSDHAAYIASWLKVLQDDRKALFTAASKATQAAEFLTQLAPQRQLVEGAR